jgi:Domain of unknown function (DUF4326)
LFDVFQGVKMQVINGNKHGFLGKNKIYIGRKTMTYIGQVPYEIGASVLANPFVMGKDGTREQVISKYREWLWNHLKPWKDSGETNPVVEELLRLKALDDEAIRKYYVPYLHEDVCLVCWCAPLPCHGDIIKKAIEWMRTLG